ncbi:hypothetical protein RFI_16354 [Reticulomyxa filosa]|uniref:Uncharacterized protein n=1 Tax=Reticulomyxa filosa TaxID=46433 RepID=X6N6D9_RETFI|nr:hypothetical protein RFI_16354 [Reticulomyxa filosa]|eukprot:ETO20857.1 hypothetical protein RFI_16354 [Reticulomyxa filosa]
MHICTHKKKKQHKISSLAYISVPIASKEEDDNEKDGADSEENQDEDDFNGGTMIGPDKGDDNENENNSGGDENGYNDGTMVKAYDDGTMINNGVPNENNSDGDDNERANDSQEDNNKGDAFDDSTMLVNSAKRSSENKERESEHENDNPINSDEEPPAKSTAKPSNAKNTPTTTKTPKTPKRVLDFPESIFLNNDRINKMIPLPKDATTEELTAVWNKVKQVQTEDQKKLDTFYTQKIQQIQARIESLSK